MGYQIIKQPSGQFAIFSSYTDTVIVWDATRDEIVDWFVEQETAKLRDRLATPLDHVEADEPRKAYYQFALSWEEALELDREHDGEAWRADIGEGR